MRASPHPPHGSTPPHLAEPILISKTVLEGERKQVTVLLADLKRSMELLAERDPEDAWALLDPVLERMMAAVHRYDGTVNQVMGDGIMALFRAPRAHEDHAVRASYAALHMQEAMGRYAAALRPRRGLDVEIRVGLNSGEVVVRAIDSALGYVYGLSGRVTEALPLLEGAVKSDKTMGIMTGQPLVITWLSESYVRVHHLQEAVALAGQALDLARACQERGNEADALRLLGDIAAHGDPPDIAQAEAHNRQALALAADLGMRPLQAHCHRGLGSLYAKVGWCEQARSELSAAIELYRTMEMMFWLPEAEAPLARMEGR